MQIIPVIDLKDGVVVHAKQGQRHRYAPINTPLCPSSELPAVITAYLHLYSFTTFYIADLNAIAGDHCHQTLINRILNRFPHLTFWIDSGYQSIAKIYAQPNYRPILGTESLTSVNYITLSALKQQYILSLDFLNMQLLGAKQLLTPSSLWPKNIIIMTLHRVGSSQGPDIQKLQQFATQFPSYQFIAAGGIRNLEDLKILNNMGITTALIASALHNGSISANDLQQIIT